MEQRKRTHTTSFPTGPPEQRLKLQDSSSTRLTSDTASSASMSSGIEDPAIVQATSDDQDAKFYASLLKWFPIPSDIDLLEQMAPDILLAAVILSPDPSLAPKLSDHSEIVELIKKNPQLVDEVKVACKTRSFQSLLMNRKFLSSLSSVVSPISQICMCLLSNPAAPVRLSRPQDLQ
jgi:hypothetical protein